MMMMTMEIKSYEILPLLTTELGLALINKVELELYVLAKSVPIHTRPSEKRS